MKKALVVRPATLAILALLVAGCGDSTIETYPAKGTLKIKGHEGDLPGGISLTLANEDGSALDVVTGADVQPDGSFVFRTGEEEGAPEGKYKAVVNVMMSMGASRPPTGGTPPAAPTKEEMMSRMTGGEATLVHSKYRNGATSPITIEVSTDGAKNVYTIELDEAASTAAPAGQ